MEEFSSVLKRYLENKVSKEEKLFVDEWFSSMEKKNTSELSKREQLDLQEKIWNRIQKKLRRSYERPSSSNE